MRINPNGNTVQQAEQVSRVRESANRPTPAAGAPTTPTVATPRVDRVEISDAGRAMAAKGAEGSGEMSADRVAELRERVLSGAYNSLDVVDKVARRLLDAGDV